MKKRLSLLLLVSVLLVFSAAAAAETSLPDWIKFYVKYPLDANWTQVGSPCLQSKTCTLSTISTDFQIFCKQEGDVLVKAESHAPSASYAPNSIAANQTSVYTVNYDSSEASCICLRSLKINTSWGADLNATSNNLSYGCCGDDAGDQGISFQDMNDSYYYICDNSGTDMIWRGLDKEYRAQWHPKVTGTNRGGIYHINTKIGTFSGASGVNDSYDVVANEYGQWIPCDIDGSLTPVYAPNGVFTIPCVGKSSPNCIMADKSNYVCYPEENNESIYECALSKQTALSTDERQENVLGDVIPKVFSDNIPAYFLPAPSTGTFCANSEYCVEFTGLGAVDKVYTRKAPRLKNWTAYSYFTFNINFQKQAKAKNFTITINSWSDLLSKYMIGMPKNGWNRVMVPVSKLPDKIVNSIQISTNTASGFVKFSDFRLEGGLNGLYCGKNTTEGGVKGKWLKDFDADSTSNGTACNMQKAMGWTGNYCCNDDYTIINNESGYYSEFYTDTDGNCWDGRKVGNSGVLVNISNRMPILSFQDKFYGCFATQLFEIKSTNTQLPIVQGIGVCDHYAYYYCSNFAQGWSNLGYIVNITESGQVIGTYYVSPGNRTTLRYSPDTSTADCCRPEDCWDGTNCRGDQSYDSYSMPYGLEQTGMITPNSSKNYTGYRCMNGTWVNSSIKWDWFDMNWGYCRNEGDCLLNASACVPNSWYSRNVVFGGMQTADVYCKNSSWTTRTRQLAQEMLNIRSNDYVLDCGPYNKVLNYWWNSSFIESESFLNIANPKEINNLCVLSYKDLFGSQHIVVGTTFNSEAGVGLNFVLANAFNLVNVNMADCMQNDSSFHSCGQGLWWNNKEQSLIYDASRSINLGGNMFTKLYDYLLKQVYGLLGIELPASAGGKALEFLSRARLLNEIFVSRHGNTAVRAFVEPKYEEPEIKRFFTASFENFTTPVCDTISTYDVYVASIVSGATPAIYCTRNNQTNTDTVVAVDKAVGAENFDKLVSMLTRQTRVK